MIKLVLDKIVGELRSGRVIAIALLITAALAIAGPFNTYMVFALKTRAIFWGLVVFVSLAVSIVIRVFINIRMAGAPYWQRGGLLVLCMSLCLTPLLLGLNAYWLRGTGMEEPNFLRLGSHVALISTVIAFIRYLVEASQQTPGPLAVHLPDPVSSVAAAPQPRLYNRLPKGATGQIQRLSADDHFVLIHTLDSTHQVRMRFADAIAEMDTVIGHCAHRSHWVVADAVAGVEREGAKLFLRMLDGARVPVSRKYRPGLEAAGLIEL